MNDIEAKKQLMDLLLLLAVQEKARELYLFAVEDRLFVNYTPVDSDPRLAVLEGAGALYRVLLGTMENRRVMTQEINLNPEWCLDFGPVHFDLTTTHVVVVRIAQSAVSSQPPPPSQDDELVIDESELAAAVEEPVIPPPEPEDDVPIIIEPPTVALVDQTYEKTPEEQAMEMVGFILHGIKPFPKEVVQLVPVHLTNRGRFVPLFIDADDYLWVAMNDLLRKSAVQDMVGREVEVLKVDYQKLEDLLIVYRTDPRHKR